MREKNFFLNIKKQLPKGCFIQKIENKFNSGFVDLILITEKNPLFIELKTTKKGNRINVEKSQISTHLRISANNYVSFFLVHDSLSSNLFLFDGGKLCKYLAKNGLCTLIVSKEIEHGFLIHGSLKECLDFANHLICEGEVCKDSP